eukprot:5063882-Amphidinium_carterae.1
MSSVHALISPKASKTMSDRSRAVQKADRLQIVTFVSYNLCCSSVGMTVSLASDVLTLCKLFGNHVASIVVTADSCATPT